MAVAPLFLLFLLFLIIPKLGLKCAVGFSGGERCRGPTTFPKRAMGCAVAPMLAVRCPPGVEVRKERSSSALPSRAPGQAAELCGMSRCLQLLQDGGCLRACVELGALLLCSPKPPLGRFVEPKPLQQGISRESPICTSPAPLAAP